MEELVELILGKIIIDKKRRLKPKPDLHSRRNLIII